MKDCGPEYCKAIFCEQVRAKDKLINELLIEIESLKEVKVNYTSLEFSKTVQVNQFEPETIKVQVNLEVSDDFKGCFNTVKQQVYSLFYGENNAPVGTPVEPRDSDKKQPAPKPEESKSTASTPQAEEAPAKPKAKAKVKETKAKAPKVVNYDRSNEAHKGEFIRLLDRLSPGWDKKIPHIAKEISVKLEGTPFLNAEGLPLLTFEEGIKVGLKVDL